VNWSAAVDLYCERTAPGLWNEPLNALTNLAFWAAAIVVARRCRRAGTPLDAELMVLWWMLWAIGAGSLALHTLATRAGGAVDTLAILLYLHTWCAAYLWRVWQLPWRMAWLGIPAFLLATQALAPAWRALGLQPAGYLAAWTVLLGCAVAALARDRATALCEVWPHGTHFAWHLLNAWALGLSLWALAARTASGTR
jgi:hypothetical protein